MKDDDNFLKLLAKHARSDIKKTRIVFLVGIILFTLVMYLVAYVGMGESFYTNFLGK